MRWMRWVRRGWYWYLDYWYIWWAQTVGLFTRRTPTSFESGDRAPVVLLAGVYEPWSLLRPSAEALSAAGHPVHVVSALGYNRAPIEKAAVSVMAYIVERDLRGVILVAHSKGGLVGKHVLAIDDTDGRVDRLVSVATPFGGSTLAPLVPSRTVRALGPAAAIIVTLAANLEVNAKITSIYGDYDPHIPGGSNLVGATNVEIPIVGHFRLLSDRRVVAAVVDAASR